MNPGPLRRWTQLEYRIITMNRWQPTGFFLLSDAYQALMQSWEQKILANLFNTYQDENLMLLWLDIMIKFQSKFSFY